MDVQISIDDLNLINKLHLNFLVMVLLHIEKIIYANITNEDPNSKVLKYYLKKYNVTYNVLKKYNEHHFFHACAAYYKSGFNESYVLVADGSGHYYENKGDEIISCYYFKKNKYKTIFKLYKRKHQ